MEVRDRKGLTEAEFLAAYRPKDYPRPSVTADLVIFIPSFAAGSFAHRKVLLIRRGGHPYLGKWALPGGFVNPEETVEAAACRELAEETGLTNVDLRPVGLFSAPHRDPRGWTMSEAYTAQLDEEMEGRIVAGDDAADAAWFALESTLEGDRLTLSFTGPESFEATLVLTRCSPEEDDRSLNRYRIADSGGLAFDHAEMIARALDVLGQRPDSTIVHFTHRED